MLVTNITILVINITMLVIKIMMLVINIMTVERQHYNVGHQHYDVDCKCLNIAVLSSMNSDVETLQLQRLYKNFDIIDNRFHTSNQQRAIACNN